jgi:hypothetical protein
MRMCCSHVSGACVEVGLDEPTEPGISVFATFEADASDSTGCCEIDSTAEDFSGVDGSKTGLLVSTICSANAFDFRCVLLDGDALPKKDCKGCFESQLEAKAEAFRVVRGVRSATINS